jgi:PAS domain-containing protein
MAHERSTSGLQIAGSEVQSSGPGISSVHCSRVQPEYVTVVNARRRFVEVSPSFCKLLGYTQEELVGQLFDDFTVPRTSNIPIIWRLFVWAERMAGIWVFAHRNGTKLFLRYEAFARDDGLYEAHMELLGAGA